MELTFPPPVPPGRALDLPGRGTTLIREDPGPPGAPTVVLLHGWLATADLNWFTCYAELGRHFRVVAMDHRGHGHGIRSRAPFRLADCAGDVAAVIERLGCGPAVVVGYSMGGPVAQLCWRDHPTAVSGLVLCATSRTFPSSTPVRTLVSGLAMGVAALPPRLRRRLIARALTRGATRMDYRRWLLGQVGDHRVRDLLEAGRELGRFDSRPWIGAVDVPTAVLVHLQDTVVPPERQRRLAAAIPGATLREVAGDHLAVANAADQFVPELVAACLEVAGRSEAAA